MQTKEAEKLEAIVIKFQDLRTAYHNYVKMSDTKSKDSLVAFEEEFCSILADLVAISPIVYSKRVQHDDRSSSSFKARICRSIYDGINKEFAKEVSWSKVESFAAASKEMSDYLSQRSFWYESYDTIEGIRIAIQSYLTAITHRINKT
jgi:hypothetical protein